MKLQPAATYNPVFLANIQIDLRNTYISCMKVNSAEHTAWFCDVWFQDMHMDKLSDLI